MRTTTKKDEMVGKKRNNNGRKLREKFKFKSEHSGEGELMEGTEKKVWGLLQIPKE